MRSIFSDFRTVTKLTESEFRNFYKVNCLLFLFCRQGNGEYAVSIVEPRCRDFLKTVSYFFHKMHLI